MFELQREIWKVGTAIETLPVSLQMIKSMLSQHPVWACLQSREQLYKWLLLASFDLEMLALKGTSDELHKLIDTLSLCGY